MDDKIEMAYSVDMNEGTNALEISNVCRVCLQDGELISIFDKAQESEFSHAEKIMQVVTSVDLKRKQSNLPQQICTACITDLETSYRFIKTCESSDAILQTYTIPNNPASEASEDHNKEEDEEEELDEEEEIEQEFPVDDLYIYKYKTEIYGDSEMIVEGEKNELIVKEVDAIEPEITNVKVTKVKRDKRQKRAISQQIEKDQEKIHICEICANQYKYRHALEVHMRRHRGDKPFKCEYCNRSFVIRFELKRHMRVHTGQKPYNCRYCERKFSDFGSRIKHERSHTGERPYVCQTCGKTFAYSHVLSGHLLTHTGEKRHQCGTCGKRFTKSHHLKSHLNTHLKTLNKQTTAATREQVGSVSHEIKQEQQNIQTIQPEQELLNVVYM
ncbi:hypothetical protein PVAND_016268 [Polypedilum vanderplanki]|uniref:Zinc finger protein n=1 Tax=Polypedilum vanderplanki TaxID=319348 RepID=A0A9J6BEM3_POLVA|nr:hypothetical protein PVAND_016268 [Polypedilum vanderplanki]